MLEPHKDDLLEYIELTIHHAVLVERDPDDPAVEEVEHRLEGLWDRLSAEERRRAGVAGSRLNQIGRRGEKAVAILRRLADKGPIAIGEADVEYCFYCDGEFWWSDGVLHQEHETDCTYVAAEALLVRLDKEPTDAD